MTIHLRATVCSGIGALLFGGLLGFATVDGVRPQSPASDPIYPRAVLMADSAEIIADDGCTGCTTYDQGYRWASVRHITETDDCFGDDWSRQSGCLAYVHSSRLE